jgi:hypothetical protein
LSVYDGEYNQLPELEKHYVYDRAKLIKWTLEDKPLYMISDKVVDNPACTTFRDDFKQQKNVELIAPIVRAHAQYHEILNDYIAQCDVGGFIRNAGTFGETNYNLYKINDKLFVLQSEQIDKERQHYYGKDGELVESAQYRKKVVYTTIDAGACKSVGSYSDSRNLNEDMLDDYPGYLDSPELPINGIVKYQGEYYIYKLSEKRFEHHPLNTYQLKRNDREINDSVCVYDHRHPSQFESRDKREKRWNSHIAKLRTPTEIGEMIMGPHIGTVKVVTQLVGDRCKLTFRKGDELIFDEVELNPKNWCPDSSHFQVFDPNRDGYDDFVTVFVHSAPYTSNALWLFDATKNKFMIDNDFPGGWPSGETCTGGGIRTGIGHGEHVYASYKYCYDLRAARWEEVIEQQGPPHIIPIINE